MIKVIFEKSEDGKTLILKVTGHANQAEVGKDIICASASILAYTVAQIVTSMSNEKKLRKKPTIRMEEGDACITCKPARPHYNEAYNAFCVCQVGYALLAHNYPQFVEIKMFGQGDKP